MSYTHEFLLRALEAVGDVVGGLVLGDGVLRRAGHRRVERQVLRLVAGKNNSFILWLKRLDFEVCGNLRQYSHSPKEERSPAP